MANSFSPFLSIIVIQPSLFLQAVDACGVPSYSGQATAQLHGRFAVQTPESLLRPSLPSRCTAASPHPYRCLSPSWPRSSRPFLHAPPVKEIDGRRQESISLLLGAGLCREMGPVRGIDFVAACLIFPLHAQYCLWDGNWCCGLVLSRGSRSRDQKEVLAGQ